MLEVLRDLPRYEYQGTSSFLPWVLALTSNTVRSLIHRMFAQKRDRLPTTTSEAEIERLADPIQAEAAVDDRDEMQQLARVIRDLPSLQERVLEGVIVQGRSQSEVAAELGVSQATVSRSLKDALEHLRRFVSRPGPGR
jgi:RNA polymerase sigma factor (sigma-70 family)